MNYRTKPASVQAVQWTGDNDIELTNFLDKDEHWYDPSAGYLILDTLEGTLHISNGDWIVKDSKGGLSVCKPGMFIESYELEPKVADSRQAPLFRHA